MDANAYALQADDPAKALGAIIRKAEWLGKGQRTKAGTVPVADVPPPTAMPMAAEPTDPTWRIAAMRPTSRTTTRMTTNGKKSMMKRTTWRVKKPTGRARPKHHAHGPSPADHVSGPYLASALPGEGSPDADAPPNDSPPPVLPPLPAPILAASPLPPAPQEIEAEVSGDEVVMQLGHRHYRVRGLSKNLAFDQIKVNVLAIDREGHVRGYVRPLHRAAPPAIHRRRLPSNWAWKSRPSRRTWAECCSSWKNCRTSRSAETMVPKEPAPTMTPEEKDAALRLLRDPNLLDRIVADFDVVGETTNKLVGYLAAVTRKLDQPLAMIIQSSPRPARPRSWTPCCPSSRQRTTSSTRP